VNKIPQHIAIIMDGNGRWARRRGMPRTEGHRRGMKAALAMLDIAPAYGVKYLTLYAFSSENWKRPKEEVDFLMKMCEGMITRELPGLIKKNIRLRHVGRMGELPLSLQRTMENAIELTRNNHRLNLQLAFNYGSRVEILDAVKKIADSVKEGRLSTDQITEAFFSDALYTRGIPDPDLLIRTSGEMRVSNYLLWQIAYAEIYVTKKFWPDFTRRDLEAAIKDYQKRHRRFGGIDD
jgi:undecaprenyl diphosphate synthase